MFLELDTDTSELLDVMLFSAGCTGGGNIFALVVTLHGVQSEDLEVLLLAVVVEYHTNAYCGTDPRRCKDRDGMQGAESSSRSSRL